MAQFIQIPALIIGRSGQWLLASELIYDSTLLESKVIVPRGFETDLASIPRIFTPLIPKNGYHRAPAIVHDFLCRQEICYRPTADKVFLEAMEVSNVAVWRRYTMYFAVRSLSFYLMNFTPRYKGGKNNE